VRVVEEEIPVRSRIAACLDDMLGDRRATVPTGAKAQGTGSASRVCDEAYLGARELVDPDPGAVPRLSPPGRFGGLSPHARDEEILGFQRSHGWRLAVSGGPEEALLPRQRTDGKRGPHPMLTSGESHPTVFQKWDKAAREKRWETTIAELPEAEKADPILEAAQRESRGPARAAVRVWLRGDEDGRAKALVMLQALDDLAIVPLLELGPPVDVAQFGSYVRLLVSAEARLRAHLRSRLVELLRDRRPTPTPPSDGQEEKAPSHRVCDEAYIAMRRLANLGQEPYEELLAIRKFDSLSEPDRDREIARAVRSGDFRHGISTGKGQGHSHDDDPL
jgi:hypothetical protein